MQCILLTVTFKSNYFLQPKKTAFSDTEHEWNSEKWTKLFSAL